MISAPHAEAGVRRHPAYVDGDVAGGIAAADNQDTPALKGRRPPEIASMQGLPREMARDVRYERIAMMPRTYDQIVIGFLAGPLRARNHDRPFPVAKQVCRLNPTFEVNEPHQAELGSVIFKIRSNESMRWEVGVIRGHRIVLELG